MYIVQDYSVLYNNVDRMVICTFYSYVKIIFHNLKFSVWCLVDRCLSFFYWQILTISVVSSNSPLYNISSIKESRQPPPIASEYLETDIFRWYVHMYMVWWINVDIHNMSTFFPWWNGGHSNFVKALPYYRLICNIKINYPRSSSCE
jgi:hypothetical protein